MSENLENIRLVYNFVTDTITDPGSLTIPKVIVLVSSSMEFVEKIRGLSGVHKKQAVLIGLETYLNKIENESIRNVLVRFVKIAGPSVIDELVKTAKRPHAFGKSRSRGCFFSN